MNKKVAAAPSVVVVVVMAGAIEINRKEQPKCDISDRVLLNRGVFYNLYLLGVAHLMI